jgi:dTDP-4-dehydrorhamnose 3,5-epimerase
MRIIETPLRGLWKIEADPIEDERGFFARSLDAREWQKREMNPSLAQCNISFNHRAGTLRGLHWQAAPHEEDKLVRVTSGATWDVAVDLRSSSPTFSKWHAVELSTRNRRSFCIPKDFAPATKYTPCD